MKNRALETEGTGCGPMVSPHSQGRGHSHRLRNASWCSRHSVIAQPWSALSRGERPLVIHITWLSAQGQHHSRPRSTSIPACVVLSSPALGTVSSLHLYEVRLDYCVPFKKYPCILKIKGSSAYFCEAHEDITACDLGGPE